MNTTSAAVELRKRNINRRRKSQNVGAFDFSGYTTPTTESDVGFQRKMSVIVEIDGVGDVEFDDSFKDLTREQKQRLVNRVAADRKAVESKNKKNSDDGYFTNLARTALGSGRTAWLR